MTPAIFVIFVDFQGLRTKNPLFLWVQCKPRIFADFSSGFGGDKSTVFQDDRFDTTPIGVAISQKWGNLQIPLFSWSYRRKHGTCVPRRFARIWGKKHSESFKHMVLYHPKTTPTQTCKQFCWPHFQIIFLSSGELLVLLFICFCD